MRNLGKEGLPEYFWTAGAGGCRPKNRKPTHLESGLGQKTDPLRELFRVKRHIFAQFYSRNSEMSVETAPGFLWRIFREIFCREKVTLWVAGHVYLFYESTPRE